MDDVRDELETLERAGWDSLCAGTGADFYGETMTEDGVMVIANGMVLGRDEVVGSLRDAPTWSSYELRDLQLLPLGEDSAALLYVASAVRGDAPPFVAAMTSVYTRRHDRWRLAVYTQTPVHD